MKKRGHIFEKMAVFDKNGIYLTEFTDLITDKYQTDIQINVKLLMDKYVIQFIFDRP